MPKQKTHSGAKKRFKLTGSGKIKKQQSGMRHNLEVKSTQRKRRLNNDQLVSKADTKNIKKLLGH
ncbi:large subunit ribosomal protein L35 [Okibacterium sp. HSC-33S16]|jgi:large subunit ribosomal protein L35|uniref:50S ribosomal protein L35 n=1 Tax=Okibacterium sp. HSC-33S16 TaxID=2910965 RepID=UPI0020A1EFB1|nr:50S ribosomal protein L35 [Okibacterium sp. HSC-33S16]MCP2031960.1 large subunit ribosomal protein L35 [Okibacterium sp. HSC-33S16]